MVSKHHYVFVKKTIGVHVPLYISDILLTRKNMKMVNATRQWLYSVFEIDINEAMYVIDMEIIRNRIKS